MIRLFHFRVPLSRPLVLRHATLTEREGIILELRDSHGHVGLGECSPLPGFFSEDISDCFKWFSGSLKRVEQGDISDAPSSVQSAIAQARFLLSCNREQTSPLEKFDCPQSVVPVNALLTGDRDAILEKCSRISSEGFTAAKLKVGRLSVHEDIELVNDVRARIPSDIALRLDANQSWSYRDALEFAANVDWSGIEYCEEPLDEPTRLAALKSDVPSIRVALDESFVQYRDQVFSMCSDPVAVVLRPMMLGGLHSTRATIDHINSRGVRTVVSSAAETSVGMLSVMLCAFATRQPISPAGLDTLSWLSDDTVVHPLKIEHGAITWPDWWSADILNDRVGVWREL